MSLPVPSLRLAGGALVLLEGLLAFTPLLLLGPAIGWPASLGEPAAVQLAAIAAEPAAVRIGYSVYLLYSLLTLPVMAILARYFLPGRDAGTRALVATVVALAAASTLARCIGILRWLTVMPWLATEHAAAGPGARSEIERLFTALNEFGGGIGELLGVSTFMALAMWLLLVPAWRRRSVPRLLLVAGLAAGTALAALLLPTFGGPDLVPIAVAVTAISVWQMAVGAWLMLRREQPRDGD